MEDLSNTLRVLIATDCHLGYLEKDEIRRHDSFDSFEEICSIAEEKQVDFILLGGDLFHENKPSRTTLVRAVEILRQYCLNDSPVQFQVVSDQTVNFSNRFGHVNYEDPHYNVGLPVFTIHGNHDDPAGVDNLSAVDILSACNLVNYFGKMNLGGSGVGQITIYPILIKKGSTSVALYGLGNIRDERLNRMFQTPHAIQWMCPDAQEGCQVSDWFNILVLHQNRIKTNPKNAINEHFLPRFLDFVVWGHEHECLIDPQEVTGMGFHITQPGSSVATSLIDGESKPKHVLLLEIKGNQYRPSKIPLQSVRPFEYAEVRNLIEKSNRKAANKADAKLPLVRVKVDYSGFMTINPQRFGQKYVGKVANPQDILIFSKASRVKNRTEGKFDDSEKFRPEELNQQNIEALVAESNLKMEILPVNDLDIALHNFVNKDDKMAFHACLQHNLDETRSKIAGDSDPVKFEEEDLIVKVGECLEERVKTRATNPKTFTFSAQSEELRGKRIAGSRGAASFSDDEDDPTQISGAKSIARGRKAKGTELSSFYDVSETGKTSTRGRGRGRGRGKGATNMKQTTLDATLNFRRSQRSASVSASTAVHTIADEADSASSDDEEYEAREVKDSSDDDDGLQVKSRKRAAPKGRGRGSTQPSKRGRQSGSSSLQRMLMGNDDDDEDDDIPNRFNKSQLKITKDYGALRR
ncbi:unnamed protein product [Amaranthus hypochondriacus]